MIFLKQSQCGQWAGGFVAMDAGGKVETRGARREARGWSVERKQLEFALLAERFGSPTVLMRSHFDLAQHGADVNLFAEITAEIFAQSFHAENFTQSRQDAKNFLTQIPRINTDSIFQSP
jgi:hypothetical protein